MKSLIIDCETYIDWFCVGMKDVATGHKRYFQLFEGHPFEAEKVRALLRSHRIYTFNGRNFDMPLIVLALQGHGPEKMKEVANAIIVGGLKGWQAEDRYHCKVPANINHVDLFEVSPGKVSLKIYGGRMHSRKMQDLPIEPDAHITPEQRPILCEYCGNDLDTTDELRITLSAQLELRDNMTAQYGIDLRSKSDAQIAEAVIKHELENIRWEKIYKPDRVDIAPFRYVAPDFISFRTAQLQETLAMVERETFMVSDGGKTLMPKVLDKHTVSIGTGVYRMGIGGLHSSEKCVAHRSDDSVELVDEDVNAFYPNIILICGLYPEHLGTDFLRVYRGILSRRMQAKRAGDKVTSESLKIVANASYGKMSNVYSSLYSPRLSIQVTMTGQLSLLMLIEMLEGADIPVISANTDGVTAACPRAKRKTMAEIVSAWEFVTGFGTEEAVYKMLCQRDVNNYIAIKADGSAKFKGAYAPSGVGPPKAGATGKNPTTDICTEAVTAHLKTGASIRDTIMGCTDPRKFVSVRSVKGGALYDGEYLGRAVRWYYSIASTGPIVYAINGNKVALTDGARPLMTLPDTVPPDVDYEWYVTAAEEILKDIGVTT